MTRRIVGVVVPDDAAAGSLAAAMLEDVVDLVAGMQQVEGALLAVGSAVEAAQRVTWPSMRVLGILDASDIDASTGLTGLQLAGADEAAVVSPDVPDLPPMLVAKLFSALTTAQVAVCPADDGGLVALAAKVPGPDWLPAGLTLHATDALTQLRAVAPSRALHVSAGWHRVSGVADAMRLDPGLEGWEATRAWLATRPGR